jgi:mannosyltransferase
MTIPQIIPSPEADAPPRPVREGIVLLLIVALGLFLRIYRIDHLSLWSDEAFSVEVSRLSVNMMNGMLVRAFSHPPLSFYALHAWFMVFGFGDVQARLLSVAFGALAIVMIYLLARYMFDRRVAFLSALLLTVSQLGVMYSQEARPYAQLLFFVLCSLYLFVMALREHRALAWWAFILSAILTVYTHYYGAFVVAFLFLYGVLYGRRYALPATWLLGGAVLIVVSYVPWLATGVVRYALSSPETTRPQQPPWFAVTRRTLMDTMSMFNNSRMASLLWPAPRWALLTGGLLFTLPALLALKSLLLKPKHSTERSHRDHVLLLAILWLYPLFVIIALSSVFRVEYDTRLVFFCIVPYYILVALGISKLRSRSLQHLVLTAIMVWGALALHANYFIPYKENYRDALAYLSSMYRETDCAVFLPFEEPPLQWSIYVGDHPNLRVTTVDAIVSGQTDCDRVWVVTYRRVPWAAQIGDEGEQALLATHAEVHEEFYFWVYVCLFVPRGTERS